MFSLEKFQDFNWNFDRIRISTVMIAVLIAVLFLSAGFAAADRSVGFNYSQIVNDRGWGANLNLPVTLDEDTRVDISGNAQGSDLIRARTHLSITRDFGLIDLSIYSDSVLKGPSLSALGRQTDLGVTAAVKMLTAYGIRVGIFGRNGGAFASRNAYDDLLSQGYGESDLEAIPELVSLNPAPTGLSFQNKSSVNLLIMGTAQLPLGINMDFRVMPELFTVGEVETEPEAVDQTILSFSTKRAITDNIDVVLSADLGLQRFRRSGTIEGETSGGVSVQIPF